VQTPRRWGQASSAGTLLFTCLRVRGLRTSWLIVAINCVLHPQANGVLKIS